MASRPPVYCELCNETLIPGEDLEQHLIYEHKPRELAKQIVSQWEAEELGDAV